MTVNVPFSLFVSFQLHSGAGNCLTKRMESATLNVQGLPLDAQGPQIGRFSSHFIPIRRRRIQIARTLPMLMWSHLDFASTTHVALPGLGHVVAFVSPVPGTLCSSLAIARSDTQASQNGSIHYVNVVAYVAVKASRRSSFACRLAGWFCEKFLLWS